MNFTVIDFETASSKRASACALGIVKVENGEIVEQNAWLIRPDDMKFNGMNIGIHGIHPEDVVNEPEFDELYKNVFEKYFSDPNQLIVAHNASFDVSVLRNTFDVYNIKYPEFDYLCTVKVGKKTWPDLMNHKLNTLSDYLDFKFKHHDALDDCLACANVLINACKKEGVSTPYELADKIGLQMGRVFPKGYTPCSLNKKKSTKRK